MEGGRKGGIPTNYRGQVGGREGVKGGEGGSDGWGGE